MKKGDKLYCKQSLSRFQIERPCNFFKDKYYRISLINRDKFTAPGTYTLNYTLNYTCLVLQDEFDVSYVFYIPDDNTTNKNVLDAFYILGQEKQHLLYDYFYTPQEMRKLKLSKLNESCVHCKE